MKTFECRCSWCSHIINPLNVAKKKWVFIRFSRVAGTHQSLPNHSSSQTTERGQSFVIWFGQQAGAARQLAIQPSSHPVSQADQQADRQKTDVPICQTIAGYRWRWPRDSLTSDPTDPIPIQSDSLRHNNSGDVLSILGAQFYSSVTWGPHHLTLWLSLTSPSTQCRQ